MTPTLYTPRQGQLLAFIHAYTKLHVQPPAEADMQRHFKVIGLIDETAVAKKGIKTPGVQRQYCGAAGKIDNCVVTVHLGYAHGPFTAWLDSGLFLPQSWSDDRPRCREADIPDDLVYRPKTAIALEQVRHAVGNRLTVGLDGSSCAIGLSPDNEEEVIDLVQFYLNESCLSGMGVLPIPFLHSLLGFPYLLAGQ